MNVEIDHGKGKYFLKAEAILRFLVTDDDKLDTLILCKSAELDLITTDTAVYYALASVKPDDQFKLNKLAKLLEVTDVQSAHSIGQRKPILTHERAEQIRKIALR